MTQARTPGGGGRPARPHPNVASVAQSPALAGLPPDVVNLAGDIAQDVVRQIGTRRPQAVGAGGELQAFAALPHFNPAALSLPDISSALPYLIRGGLDLAIRQFGGTLEAGVRSHHDQIRAWVSDYVLKYIEGLTHSLQEQQKLIDSGAARPPGG